MHYDAPMSGKTLQIRRLPDDVYETLALRAQREGRSLAQQAVADLRRVGEAEGMDRRRRQAILDRVREQLEQETRRPMVPAPEELVREDRER